MPYITEQNRISVNKFGPTSSGELNYAICRLISNYLGDSPDYSRFNDAIGALEGAKFEIHRRLIVPYENQKIHDNGDVF
jgi:hypothetical protein